MPKYGADEFSIRKNEQSMSNTKLSKKVDDHAKVCIETSDNICLFDGNLRQFFFTMDILALLPFMGFPLAQR